MSPHRKDFSLLVSWALVVLWRAFIFFCSSIPGKDIPHLFVYQDILSQGIIYGILGLFFLRALKQTFTGLSTSWLIVFAVLGSTIFGITDEIHQRFVPGRTASLTDLSVDLIGSSIGAFLGKVRLSWLWSKALKP